MSKRIEVGDRVQVRQQYLHTFPTLSPPKGRSWTVESAYQADSVVGGRILTLEGFNEFHESWFEVVESDND